MKKLYIQPQTGFTGMLTSNVLKLTSSEIDNNPTSGMDGAPARQQTAVW